MANYLTEAQRYNNRLHKVFEEGKRLNAIHDAGRAKHSKEAHKGEYSSCKNCFPSDAKSRALSKAKK